MASGILNVNKPSGPSSFGVVRRVKRLPGIRKVGHGGTLDPAADGVLPVLVNSATRLADFIHAWPKTYLATIVFGAESDTGDGEGRITRAGDPATITRARIEATFPSFIGWIEQVPPSYSALKRGGEALYRKARRGEPVQLPPRRVEIRSITLLDYRAEQSAARLRIESGRGMYVRSLAQDLGRALGCGAYLDSLTRLAVGPLRLEQAIEVSQLVELGDQWPTALLPAELPIKDWPALALDAAQVAAVKRGQPVTAPFPAVGRYRLMDEAGELIGWGEAVGSQVRPRAVFDV